MRKNFLCPPGKRFRPWVRHTANAIVAVAIVAFGTALVLYMFIGAALQTSYRLSPPSAEEIHSVQTSHSAYGYLVKPYEAE